MLSLRLIEPDDTSYDYVKNTGEFWKIIRPLNDVVFKIEQIDFIEKSIYLNLINFTLYEIGFIYTYLIDLTVKLHRVNEEGYREAIKLCWRIGEHLQAQKNKNQKLHYELLPKIHEKFVIEKRINCPYNSIIIGHEKDYEEDEMYYVLSEFRRELLIHHYYLMIHIFVINLRMQKIKSELIKYELARNGKYSGTPIDIIVDELFSEYISLNEEFLKYNGQMTRMNYYCIDSCSNYYLYPNNISIMSWYDDCCFDWDLMQFRSVLNDSKSNIKNIQII